jgi:hypothetical protein
MKMATGQWRKDLGMQIKECDREETPRRRLWLRDLARADGAPAGHHLSTPRLSTIHFRSWINAVDD